ncbi:MAG: amidophosphoribosyltransferase, partial [Paludibacteraceae bacterium]|nr:amidophosphoribosyltransferase [Paludibacteraceae bacterium]
VSSAPQIRYPDFYGIDMSALDSLIAFRAAVELTKEAGNEQLLTEVYNKCVEQENLPALEQKNYVSEIYSQFTDEEISRKIAELITPNDIDIDIRIVFQSLEGLHAACPNHTGDWYFSGHYPTPGGVRMLGKAYIAYYMA